MKTAKYLIFLITISLIKVNGSQSFDVKQFSDGFLKDSFIGWIKTLEKGDSKDNNSSECKQQLQLIVKNLESNNPKVFLENFAGK